MPAPATKHTDARAALAALVSASGLTATEVARALGRDPRTFRRWLSGQQEIPQTLAEQVERLRVSEVTRDTVWMAWRR